MRPFFTAIVVFLVSLAGVVEGREPAAKRPNILWIVAENIDHDLGCYGGQHVQTPNADRLAREGTRFTRVFATAPVCATSRSAFMTGMYQTTTDTHHMRSHRNDNFRLPAGVRPVTHWLRDAGYATFNIGAIGEQTVGTKKLDLNFVNEGAIYESDDWTALKTRQPFFAVVNTPEVEYDIYDRQSAKKSRVEWVGEREHPAIAKPETVRPPPYFPDHPAARDEWCRYLNSVSGLDRRVGVILDSLRRDGLEDDTIVIFFADNGRLDPRGIHFCYDSGLRVPLIIRWPKNFPAPADCPRGSVRDEVVSLLDLTATTLTLAGVPRPPLMQSRVFLGSASQSPREYAFSARDRIDETVNRVRTVRDRRFRYIRNFMPQQSLAALNRYREKCFLSVAVARQMHAEGKLSGPALRLVEPTSPSEELYDTQIDPFELTNLASSPDSAHQQTLQRLRAALNTWMIETGDRGEVPEPPEVIAPFEKEMHDWFGTPAWHEAARRKPNAAVAVPSEKLIATLVRSEDTGGRRGGAVRYAAASRTFLLWGFVDGDPEFPQERPSMSLPEHDVVFFDDAQHQWRDHVSETWRKRAAEKAPLYFVPRCYHGLTTGSERSLFRAPEGFDEADARPDLNISFDQAVYHAPTSSMIYFTGGLTVAYNVEMRRWKNLAPKESPPPVLGGSLAYDPLHDELVLFGGGHIAERRDDGRIVGYTDTWLYSFQNNTWRQHRTERSPPPRMYSRLMLDEHHRTLVLFGGDGQSHYLADTWLFDLASRTWREVKAPGPPPRAGQLAFYVPHWKRCVIGGGFHNDNLNDLWSFDVKSESWRRLAGELPTANYLSGDFDSKRRRLLFVANDRAPNHGRSCDVHFARRTTYSMSFGDAALLDSEPPVPHVPLAKNRGIDVLREIAVAPTEIQQHETELKALPANRWSELTQPRHRAPVRTWGSATFDSERGRILLWGGGHCGYGGGDVDAYDVARHAWLGSETYPEFPHRLWARGVRLAGVTFSGNPWTEHGRRIFAYDPPSRRMIAVRPIVLTTGYEPESLRGFPGAPRARIDAVVNPPTTYNKYVTWSLDLDTGRWDVVGPAPVGLDTLVSSASGVLGVNVDWPTRLKDSGYMRPWDAEDKPDYGVFRFDAKARSWRRLGASQPGPQNLYEMTSLAHDSKRDRLLLHGAGERRSELWEFDLQTHRWRDLRPTLAGEPTAAPPDCNREMVYVSKLDSLVTFGPAPSIANGTGKSVPTLFLYDCERNQWRRSSVAPPEGISPSVAQGQNRALVYDAARDLLLLVLGEGNNGESRVFALRLSAE